MFIQLQTALGQYIYVNPDHVTHITDFGSGGVARGFMHNSTNDHFDVKGEAEEIVSDMNDMLSNDFDSDDDSYDESSSSGSESDDNRHLSKREEPKRETRGTSSSQQQKPKKK